ncbi:MAG: DNA mismatch repair protein MutS [Mesorhizobium sp.]|uniref:Smr/MutS family protein n=1 Tax=unclassified Mesorhizobium TaxID=325217 RepID=UPI000F7529AD|nr:MULTISPECIES: Smr/MutS family protein [unclassified Mesorhizobium]AZO49860.1 DNA mismatch repair protein MutS [Mesorhizobium sp. M4B.F.Ca.ET.058.02.1.1]RUX41742.1 DNA mismatch repair protein MutS [Mesorhizobium sp. M4A.F.Ca.ET.050.02.1.1]RVC42998.1 DNA mismatch repair protein MutS [Mesorhizobium sp. M4A.F.Ca.ET.090.04.2.1]RVD30949.1 DNA mismatch repair protein MutS [Mesorhizobium sp. M4A.F.Ca.ET.020.02.1.1]RWC18321.1 MAG: DNA mismatch repair protein MutS [Mesorhizobium sp.]
MTRRIDRLSEDDRVLWNLVARTAKPLKGKAAVDVPDFSVEPKPAPAPIPVNGAPAVAAKPRTQHVSHALDDQTLNKLAKGRLPIEGRVDLHGMTQDEAYSLLFSFLHRAHAGGIRYVLVITGKGSSSGGDGVLRRSVPAWLSTPAFRPLVSSHDHAARNHGGSGALYVRLRRTRT